MEKNETSHWWQSLLPDARTWVSIGYFSLVWRVLYMIERNPALLGNAAFMTVVTLIAGTGGLGIVGAFYFGGTKVGSEVMANQSRTLASGPPPGTTVTTTTPPADASVTMTARSAGTP